MANKKGFGYSFSLDTSDFKKGCKEVQQALDKTFGKNLMALSGGALAALAGISAAMAGIGAAAMAMGEKLDSALTGLKGLWGTAEKATEQYERLKTISENSMFGIEALTAVDRKISALGVSAEESATILTRLGNTVVGVGGTQQTLEAMADALVRIKTTGQVSSRGLMEFAKAGIKVDDLIGGSASDAINKLIERMKKFDGVMQEESTDIWIQYKKVVKIANDALAQLGNYLNDNFKEYVVAVVDKISDLRDKFVALLNDKDGMKALTKHIEIFAGVITAVAIPAMVRMAVGFAPVIASALSLIGTISALVLIVEDLAGENSIIISGFKKISLTFRWLIANIRESTGGFLEQLFTSCANVFIDIANQGIKAINFLIANVQKIINAFLIRFRTEFFTLLGKMSEMSSAVGLETLGEKFNDLANKVSKGLQINIEPISELSRVNAEEVKEIIDSVVGESVEAIEDMMDEVDKDVEKSTNNYKDKIKNTIDYVKKIFDFSDVTQKAASDLNKIELTNVGNIAANSKSTDEKAKEAKEGKQKLDAGAENMPGIFGFQYQQILDATDTFIADYKDRFNHFWKDYYKTMKVEGVQKFGECLNEALWSGKNFFKSLGEGLRDLGKQILMQITKFMILKSLFGAFNIDNGVLYKIAGVSDSMTDGVVQNGKVISTDPNDFILATKHPETLGSNADGRANVVVNVNNNSDSEISTNSYFDGTRTIVDIVIDGLNRNVGGLKDMVRAI